MNLQEAKCYTCLDKWVESESSSCAFFDIIQAKLKWNWDIEEGRMEEGRKTACFLSTALNPA